MAVRIVLSILLGLFVLLFFDKCSSSKSISENSGGYTEPVYEINIRFFENGNTMNRIMNVIFHHGMLITGVDRVPLENGQHEVKVKIKNITTKQLDNAEREIRKLLSVISVTIDRK